MLNFNFSIESINDTATVVDGTHFNRTTADTLCRMINSHVTGKTILVDIQHVPADNKVYTEFVSPVYNSAGGIMWRTYHIDADGYVEDTTFAA